VLVHNDKNKKENRRKGQKSNKVVDKKNITCFYCKKKGYYQSECPAKKKAEDLGMANFMANKKNTVLMTVPTTMKLMDKTWIADSAVSSHKTNNPHGLYNVK